MSSLRRYKNRQTQPGTQSAADRAAQVHNRRIGSSFTLVRQISLPPFLPFSSPSPPLRSSSLLLPLPFFSSSLPSPPSSPSFPLEVDPLNTAKGSLDGVIILLSPVSSPRGVWSGAQAEIEFGVFKP